MRTDQRISTTQSVQSISRGEQSGALEDFSSAKGDALGQDFHHNTSMAISTERQPQFMSLEELRAEEKWLQRAIVARIEVCKLSEYVKLFKFYVRDRNNMLSSSTLILSAFKKGG